MKYKSFSAPFFNHFIEPSLPLISKLKSLHGVSKGQLHHKNCPILCRLPPYDNFKISPDLYGLPSPVKMATMIKQHAKFPPASKKEFK